MMIKYVKVNGQIKLISAENTPCTLEYLIRTFIVVYFVEIKHNFENLLENNFTNYN